MGTLELAAQIDALTKAKRKVIERLVRSGARQIGPRLPPSILREIDSDREAQFRKGVRTSSTCTLRRLRDRIE